jgi:hypothetical protein
MPIKAFHKFKGVYQPKQLATLREEAKPYIGETFMFEPLWKVAKEDGPSPYTGQWACRACAPNGDWLPFGWVPEEDIQIARDA